MLDSRANFMVGMTLDFAAGFILLAAGVHATNNYDVTTAFITF
jgi:hypothetical protein